MVDGHNFHQYTEETIDQLDSAYEKGMSVEEAAELAGLRSTTLIAAYWSKTYRWREDEAVTLYEEGYTSEEIAGETNLPESRVIQYLEDNDLVRKEDDKREPHKNRYEINESLFKPLKPEFGKMFVGDTDAPDAVGQAVFNLLQRGSSEKDIYEDFTDEEKEAVRSWLQEQNEKE